MLDTQTSISSHLKFVRAVYRHAAYHKYSDYLMYSDCASYMFCTRQLYYELPLIPMFRNVNMICSVNLCGNMESIPLRIKNHAQTLYKSRSMVSSALCVHVFCLNVRTTTPEPDIVLHSIRVKDTLRCVQSTSHPMILCIQLYTHMCKVVHDANH